MTVRVVVAVVRLAGVAPETGGADHRHGDDRPGQSLGKVLTQGVLSDGDAGRLVAVVQAVSLVAALVSVLVAWTVYAAVFYAISAFFDGDGGFATLMKFVGWGYLPGVASAAVTAVVQFVLYSGREIPADPQAMARLTRSVQADPLFLAATAFGILVTLYQGYIWSHAVAVARDLDRRDALVTAAVPVGVSVLFSLSGFLL